MKALIAALLVSLFAVAPALAGSACVFTLEDTIPQLRYQSTPFEVLTDPDEIAAFVATLPDKPNGNVTGVLLVPLDQGVAYGLVIDGCLTPPALVPGTAPAVERRSGLQPDGSIYA